MMQKARKIFVAIVEQSACAFRLTRFHDLFVSLLPYLLFKMKMKISFIWKRSIPFIRLTPFQCNQHSNYTFLILLLMLLIQGSYYNISHDSSTLAAKRGRNVFSQKYVFISERHFS